MWELCQFYAIFCCNFFCLNVGPRDGEIANVEWVHFLFFYCFLFGPLKFYSLFLKYLLLFNCFEAFLVFEMNFLLLFIQNGLLLLLNNFLAPSGIFNRFGSIAAKKKTKDFNFVSLLINFFFF